MSHLIKTSGALLCAMLLSSTVYADSILVEGFDDIASLAGKGWVLTNNSTPGGTTDWFQGNSAIFAAQSGAPDSYLAANFNAAAFSGDISLWAMTPELSFGTGASTASFWARVADVAYNDVLQIRLSASGASVDVGTTPTSLGVFSTGLPVPLADAWQVMSVTITNPGTPVAGRLAFRYVVSDTSANGDYVGIDTFEFQGPASEPVIPEPTTMVLLGSGLVGLVARRRRSR